MAQETDRTNAGKNGLISLTPGVEEPVVDIVFVHGLTGDRMGTWSKSTIMWPKDILAKEKDMKQARISTWGYDADILRFWTKTPDMGINAYAQELCHDLAGMRENTKTETLPIIFVAHSLGGLVCQEALLLGRVHSDQSIKNIGDHTRGLVFLGTPHEGSSLAKWANIGLSFVKLVKRLNRRNVKALQEDSEKLAEIGEKFPLLLHDRMSLPESKISVACFFEALPMDGVGMVVNEKSATLSGYRKVSIPQDHADMCKFTHNEDVGYKRVHGVLSEMLKALNVKMEKAIAGQNIHGEFHGNNYGGNAAGVNMGTFRSSGHKFVFNGESSRNDSSATQKKEEASHSEAESD